MERREGDVYARNTVALYVLVQLYSMSRVYKFIINRRRVVKPTKLAGLVSGGLPAGII